MPLPRPPRPPRQPPKPSAKQQKRQANTNESSAASSHKKRLRSLTRQLENRGPELPDRVRAKLEAELRELREEDARREVKRRRDKVVGKYHMIRFFDRKKATRHVKRAEKLLASSKSAEDGATAKRLLHVARVDLNYTLYHPLEKRYCALYQKGPKPEEQNEPKDNTATSSPKQAHDTDGRNELSSQAREIWEKIEELTDMCNENPEEGKRLLEELRNEMAVRVKVKGEGGRKVTSAEVAHGRHRQGEDVQMVEYGLGEGEDEARENEVAEAMEATEVTTPIMSKNRRERRRELREKFKGQQAGADVEDRDLGDGLAFFE